jgi:hypothetical protein
MIENGDGGMEKSKATILIDINSLYFTLKSTQNT